MNVFRLVLCLAGLAIYLLVRQSSKTADPADTPALAERTKSASPSLSSTATSGPSSTPHREILPEDHGFVHRSTR